MECVLGLAREMMGTESLSKLVAKSIHVVILGDNDFYSQRRKVSIVSCFRFSLSWLTDSSSSQSLIWPLRPQISQGSLGSVPPIPLSMMFTKPD